jgi:hypothetical protein
MPRGQKLVVQMVETFREHMQPAFVEKLDAWGWRKRGLALPPVMIYGEDVSHIVTEEGIANLLLCRSDQEREQAFAELRAIRRWAWHATRAVKDLRSRGIIRRAEDLGIDTRLATRDLLAARSIQGPRSRFRRSVRPTVALSPTGEWRRGGAIEGRMEQLHYRLPEVVPYQKGAPAWLASSGRETWRF